MIPPLDVGRLPTFARPAGIAVIRAYEQIRGMPMTTEIDRIRRADALDAAIRKNLRDAR